MLLVKTKLGISFIHGIGLFAAQFIPKGTVTWEYSPYFDTSYEEADVERMSPSAKEQFLKYAYPILTISSVDMFFALTINASSIIVRSLLIFFRQCDKTLQQLTSTREKNLLVTITVMMILIL